MRIIPLSLLMLATTLQAAEPMCGTSPENDQRILAARERSRGRAYVRTLATTTAPIAREGAFYLQNDEVITTDYRPFDLEGQSLELISRGNGKYEYHRRALQYVKPAAAPLRNFQGATGADWHFLPVELSRPYTIFGREATRIYVSAFNGIHLDPPVEQGGINSSSAHPAAYVHTPSAFPVYGPEKSSTMGGAYFTQQGDGTWKAHAANMGYTAGRTST